MKEDDNYQIIMVCYEWNVSFFFDVINGILRLVYSSFSMPDPDKQ